jgi:hypothetical protein
MDKERKNALRKEYLAKQKGEDRSNYVNPREAVKKYIGETYGAVVYEALGEGESLAGIIATRNQIFQLKVTGQTYEFGSYGRPVFNLDKTEIIPLSNGNIISSEEKLKRRKKYIEAGKISGPLIQDYSGLLGEWGGNPKPEPTTKQIREIYEICSQSEIPIWFVDTLETSLSWGNRKDGIEPWLRENYTGYLGTPLYKIPSIDFGNVDISDFPLSQRKIIESGAIDNCASLGDQNALLLREACKLFGLDPIIIDQRKLRDAGAYRNGIDAILKDMDMLQKKFGSLFRVECPECSKYIFNVDIQGDVVRGVCDGNVRSLKKDSDDLGGVVDNIVRYPGCGNSLEKNVQYLYTNAIPSKLLTSIYMANSGVGVFFPEREFVSARIGTGIFPEQVKATADVFNSGVPEIMQTAEFTYEGSVENIFKVLDYIPTRDIIDRLKLCYSNVKCVNINKSSIEPALINKLKKLGVPTNPRLIADVVYSLGGNEFDFNRMGWNLNSEEEYAFELLRCLGNVRQNKIVNAKPSQLWYEDYRTFTTETFISDDDVDCLRSCLINPDSPIKEVIETVYLASLVDQGNLINNGSLKKDIEEVKR